MAPKFQIPIYILLVSGLLGLSGCTSQMAVAIKPDSVPKDVSKYTLLIEDYQYQDPKIYSPFIAVNTDSLKQITKFRYSAEQLEKLQLPAEKDHPLILQTNANLDQYNNDLRRMLSFYKYNYSVVSDPNLVVMNYELSNGDNSSEGEIGGEMECNNDIGQFKYALVRKPVLHCYIDPNGVTQLSYRYNYYFQDLRTGETYPEIQVYSPDPNKSLKAIIYRLNKTQRPSKESSDLSLE